MGHARPFNFADDGPDPWGPDEIVERIQRVELAGRAVTASGDRIAVRADIDDVSVHMAARRAVMELRPKSDARYIRDELVKTNRTLAKIEGSLSQRRDEPSD